MKFVVGAAVVLFAAGWQSRANATETISVEEFRTRLKTTLDEATTSWIDADRHAFCARYPSERCESPEFAREYKRVRLLFEATRDGGFFRLRWAITNHEPSCRDILHAWEVESPISQPSATAECDELSALFAYLARLVDVKNAGLWWPRWNHVVGLWRPEAFGTNTPIVVVPTSQIFLTCREGWDTRGLGTPKKMAPYSQRDLSKPLSITIANRLLQSIQTYAPLRPDLLNAVRLHRAERYVSSIGSCQTARKQMLPRAEDLSAPEVAALMAYGNEIGEMDLSKILTRLAEPSPKL